MRDKKERASRGPRDFLTILFNHRPEEVVNSEIRILENGGNLLGMVFNNRRFHIPESVYKRL